MERKVEAREEQKEQWEEVSARLRALKESLFGREAEAEGTEVEVARAEEELGDLSNTPIGLVSAGEKA